MALKIILAIGAIFAHSISLGDSMRKFITTKGGVPTSFDPLNADSSENFHVALMMYLTPIELSVHDELRSTLLSEFSYDRTLNKMTWIVKDGPTFSDGSKITPEDVAFSVSRMAFSKPNFPVLQNIVGIGAWIASKNPLATFPPGIKIFGQKIIVSFDKPVRHPLARFVLTTFSVIPRKCVDLISNKLTCDTPVSSGYFRLQKKEQGGRSWVFERRKEYQELENKKLPDLLAIEFWSPESVIKNLPQLDSNTVIRTHESSYTPEDLSLLKMHTQQSTRNGSSFGCFNLNPKVKPFQELGCRKVFVDLFREQYQKLFQSSLPLESSLFTRLLPGYLQQSEFKKYEVKNRPDCLEKIKNNPPLYANLIGHNDFSLFHKTMVKVYEKLGVTNINPIEINTRKEMRELFLAGKISLFVSSSQFWELDPGGDLKMFLTPNMHPPLKFVTEDLQLQALVSQVDSTEDPIKNRKYFEDINLFIYDQALLNVYSHFQMLLIAKKGRDFNSLKYSLTITKPWDVF